METATKKQGFVISIGARLLIGFMALSLPLLILIMLLLPKVNDVIDLTHKIHSENLPPILDSQIYQAQDILEHWAMTGDPKDKVYFAHIWNEITHVRDQWDRVIRKLDDPKLRHEWSKLQELYLPFYQAQASVLNASRDPNNPDNVENSRNKTRAFEKSMINIIDGPYYEETGKRTGGLFSDLAREIEKNVNTIDNSLISLKKSAFWLLILAIVLTLVVPYTTQRAIAIPVDKAIDIAERIAAGERDVVIQIQSAGKLGKLLLSLKAMQEAIRKNEEILRTKEEESRELFEKLVNASKKFREYSSKVAAGDLRERLEVDKEGILHELGNDLNSMTNGLASITQKITKVSNNIVTMVGTVITSANQQAESITSQATAINEISASLEEIDKSSKETMTKAQALKEVAKNTYEQGKRGRESVQKSIQGFKDSEEKMKLIAQTILDLSNHTQQIGDITSVVNTLAQQSKMLALNASIEASKAGEAGKGFAAVANEVRHLAEQSEQSTVQVQKILEDIRRTTEKAVTVTEEGTKTLDSGTQLIEKAGQVIQALSQMIHEASISSQHIEVAIRQEAVGIEQIVESMNEINRTTSTFSSGIKEMMAFIHNLDDIAKHLKEDINLYKV
ncbi:TPA: methyl-accepting chemotaxis protein [Legionella pneumophila]|uniref:Methyl-accepting chemotaxis sensory transducer n=2 Tax=Legionella TaxID=445 RepID=A0A378PHE9_9GAMM|nr:MULTISPECIES: methyl-accepting chemotaxis protein [Legionella]MCA0402238.1 methyl-accepting chemotaxis protein [Pseudomonadota bacterium]HAT2055520.1 methyl-accepting chemotaxis protein [Legionella pneumophila]KTD70657.1 putative methyl-accepting chemotaxis sensory transducer [Legionella steigerwaltii]MBN9229004.1 methyl-accepting chemotaxis protein [Legionella steelei]MCL9684057.1 methyl-accepting chemotaxis protein [Legionella maioricensis]